MNAFLNIPCIFAFCVGVLLQFPLDLPGRLRLGELIVCAMVPLAFAWQPLIDADFRKHLARIIYCLIGLFLWHMLTDFINGVPREKSLDVWATLAVCGLQLFALTTYLLRWPSAAVPLLVGAALGSFIFQEEQPNSRVHIENEYWDLHVAAWGGSLLMAFTLLVGSKSQKIAATGATTYGLAAAYFGARSHGIVMICSAGLPYVVSWMKRYNLLKGKRSILKLSAFGLLGCFILSIVYVQVAASGLITRKSQQQLSTVKNPYNPVELIWSGRAGSIIGIEGSLKRPLFGFGSMQFYFPKYRLTAKKDAWRHVHSIVIESLVYAGYVTLFFWFLMIKILLDVFPVVPVIQSKIDGHILLAFMLMFTLLWALFFSPLVSARFILPLYVSLLFCCSQESRKKAAIL